MTGSDHQVKRIGAHPRTAGAIRSVLTGLLPIAALLCLSGCGTTLTTNQDFRERIIGVDGQEIRIEDIRTINDDANLDNDAKRQAYRDLGIVDAGLIEALLTV